MTASRPFSQRRGAGIRASTGEGHAALYSPLVQKAARYCEVSDLPASANFCLIAIHLIAKELGWREPLSVFGGDGQRPKLL